jgi:hypothetical protein
VPDSPDSAQNRHQTGSILPVPAGLRAQGRRLWRDVVGGYSLRADERRVLEDSCRLADVVSALERAMRGQPMVVKGSMGQDVLNPLLAEQRVHRLALAALLRQLKLPDESGGRGATPNQHRAAAQSRWEAAHGKDGA